MADIFVIYMFGVLIARIQLQYWFSNRIILDKDYEILTILSALSWAIYPAYLVGYILKRLNIK